MRWRAPGQRRQGMVRMHVSEPKADCYDGFTHQYLAPTTPLAGATRGFEFRGEASGRGGSFPTPHLPPLPPLARIGRPSALYIPAGRGRPNLLRPHRGGAPTEYLTPRAMAPTGRLSRGNHVEAAYGLPRPPVGRWEKVGVRSGSTPEAVTQHSLTTAAQPGRGLPNLLQNGRVRVPCAVPLKPTRQ